MHYKHDQQWAASGYHSHNLQNDNCRKTCQCRFLPDTMRLFRWTLDLATQYCTNPCDCHPE